MFPFFNTKFIGLVFWQEGDESVPNDGHLHDGGWSYGRNCDGFDERSQLSHFHNLLANIWSHDINSQYPILQVSVPYK